MKGGDNISALLLKKGFMYNQKYYLENKNKLSKRMAKYYRNNKERWQEHHQENREEILKRQKQWRKDNPEYFKKWRENNPGYCKYRFRGRVKFINDYKLSRGCSVCGYNKCAGALEFHHDGDKGFNVGTVKRKYGNLKKLKEEMKKCVILCANCHRELHEKKRKEEMESEILLKNS